MITTIEIVLVCGHTHSRFTKKESLPVDGGSFWCEVCKTRQLSRKPLEIVEEEDEQDS